jgi:hypothetical protein
VYYFPVLLYAFAYGQFCAERHSFISVHIVFHEGLNKESQVLVYLSCFTRSDGISRVRMTPVNFSHISTKLGLNIMSPCETCSVF